MKKILIWISLFALVFDSNVQAQDEPNQLYAQSAVLMDADTGRVLFEKNGTEKKAMASTTKIMTCILALEYGEEEAVVTFSENAARQPKVHLGAKSGEEFYLRDLLYSLMLESHNDSAVAIAESISGDVKTFAALMNRKAKEIGCKDTYFITPNGLDAEDEKGIHGTTAVDLARIMSYCIKESAKRERFIEITALPEYCFQNIEGNRSYSCRNHNSFLNMMDEAISGKTGFTSKAGYCYVGAVESEGRKFVVSLLGCGWPNNKTYKWQDMKKLIEYGMSNYTYRHLHVPNSLEEIQVENGIPKSGRLYEEARVVPIVKIKKEWKILLSNDEKIEMTPIYRKEIEAPIAKGEQIGVLLCMVDGKEMGHFPIVAKYPVEKRIFGWYFGKIIELYTL